MPETNPAANFQGGSLATRQVVFCQSLAQLAAHDGVDLQGTFAHYADIDGDNVISRSELDNYFAQIEREKDQPTIEYLRGYADDVGGRGPAGRRRSQRRAVRRRGQLPGRLRGHRVLRPPQRRGRPDLHQ